MSKPVTTFVFKVLRNGLLRYILYTCPNLWWRSCSKCYGMDCFGTYPTHVQTCDDVRVQSATEWTASVHTLHMSKPVMTFVFKVLRNGLLRYILYTCPNLWWRSASQFGWPAGWQDCRPAGRGQNSEQIHGAIYSLIRWVYIRVEHISYVHFYIHFFQLFAFVFFVFSF